MHNNEATAIGSSTSWSFGSVHGRTKERQKKH